MEKIQVKTESTLVNSVDVSAKKLLSTQSWKGLTSDGMLWGKLNGGDLAPI